MSSMLKGSSAQRIVFTSGYCDSNAVIFNRGSADRVPRASAKGSATNQ